MASVSVLTVTEGIVSNIAANALEHLAEAISVKISSWWSPRNDLKKLDEKMRFIQARIRDAESRQEGENSEAIKLWLHRLKMVFYRAEDLFEEVIAIDRQNQQDQQMKSMLGKVVGLLFSKAGPLSFNPKLASEIKSIKEELDDIESIMVGLGLSPELPSKPTPSTMNRETASYVNVESIIGREDDKKVIIEMLFDPKYDEQKSSIIPIVGFGGIGKTTLAQMVFNDESVNRHFDPKTWVCVPEVGDQEAILRRVYHSFTDDKDFGTLLLNQIKSGIYQSINKKKYLLVLDDIWDESRNNWLDLLELLDCGEAGSRVIVTTRSVKVANAIGTTKPHSLGLLTDEESWNLFQKCAFKSGNENSNRDLVQIGKEIVAGCGNVPLAIIVVGSLLYSQDSKDVWKNIQRAQLEKKKLTEEDDKIMHVLKLSYDCLEPTLKQCFAYCSVFPKDYLYYKADLVRLWMAQGYVESLRSGEENFMKLVQRSLFQGVKEYNRRIVECKMHDLVHDLAQRVADDEIKHVGDPSVQINNEVIHVSVNVPVHEGEIPPGLLNAPNMRSLLFLWHSRSIKASSLEQVVLNCKSLRALDLTNMMINMVPDSIGNLMHLRYLNLASTTVECLPDAITRLENLQTLNLRNCTQLKQLPKGFGKLANLRHLFIRESGLTDFPPGIGKLTSLKVLDKFPVGESSGIDSLPALNLMGHIDIEFYKCRNDAVLEAERATLKSNEYLTSLTLDLNRRAEEEMDNFSFFSYFSYNLELPPNLEYLQVQRHGGYAMPHSWLDRLRMLVSITINKCSNCKALPHFSQLPSLKSLSLFNLPSLEYVEDENDIGVGGADFYFPSLEDLELVQLRELKGWTRPSDVDGVPRQLLFPRLSKLIVYNCRKLMLMPLAPELESLDTTEFNGSLLKPYTTLVDQGEASSSPLVTPCSTLFPSLKTMRISGANELISLPISNRLGSLESLIIRDVDQLMSLTLESPTSIRDLKIINCRRLRNLSVGNLCALETLVIHSCGEAITITGWEGLRSIRSLTLSNINNMMKKLPQPIACLTTLEYLEIKRLPNLIQLPQQMGNLSLLRELQIGECPKLKSLPPSLLGLTSLHTLRIVDCPNLQKRYQKPNGEDCHLLQHVPKVSIKRKRRDSSSSDDNSSMHPSSF